MKVTTDACLFGAWVSEELQKEKRNIQNVLDVGTGTGLLSLMMAQKTEAKIDAVEIDAQAAVQAKENAAASPWSERINIIQADVQQWQPQNKYDCIVTNPPFYESELRSESKAKNIAHHDTGLTLQHLFRFVQSHLADNGILFLLLPAKRENDLDKLLQLSGFHLYHKTLVRQTLNHQPFRLMIKAGKKEPGKAVINEMSIRNENNEYTASFFALLKDYYLYL